MTHPERREEKQERGTTGRSTGLHICPHLGAEPVKDGGKGGHRGEGAAEAGATRRSSPAGLGLWVAFTCSVFIKPSEVLSANSSTEKEGLEMEAGHAVFKWQIWI